MRNSSRPFSRFAWILLISALQLLGPIYATAGILPTGDFTPTYNGTDDPWNVGGDLKVGDTGVGTLSIDGGSEVNSTVGSVGDSSGSNGAVNVTGAGSTWNNTNFLYVGRFGDGTLDVAAGGTVNSSTSYIGDNAFSTGAVTVTGQGSSWDNEYRITVGDFGNGTLSIEAGGTVTSSDGWVGSGNSGTGEVTVSGEGSSWNNLGGLYIAQNGMGTLNISGGVVNVNEEILVGNNTSSTGVINFDQGTLNTGELRASPDELRGVGTINAKGLVSDVDMTFNSASGLEQQLVLGSLPGQNITINLDVSVPAENSSLGVGYRGTGTLTIADGMNVDSSSSSLGVYSGSNGIAIVTGAGSTWQTTSGMLIGFYGNGQLRIESGAHVTSGSGNTIGYHSGSIGSVTVTGAGSTWNIDRPRLVVGYSGDGELNIAGGGIVNVDLNTWTGLKSSGSGVINFDSGTLNTKGLLASPSDLLGTGTIHTQGIVSDFDLTFDSTHGRQQQFILNSLPGQNIALNINLPAFSTNLYLGAGYRSAGKLTIADGSSISSDHGYLGIHPGSTGTATISGPGSTWRNRFDFTIGQSGDGNLVIEDGGTVYSGATYVGTTGDSTGTVTITGAGSTWNISERLRIGVGIAGFLFPTGNGYTTISDGGMISVAMSLGLYNDSHINITTGGKLALFGDADDSLTEFLDMISGSDALNYWNGTTWSDITNATFGLDYTLEYQNTGNLAGYTLLTVGIPGDFDGDRDVDGSDFLMLQRGMGTLYGTSELEAWETNYGATPLSQPGDFNNDGGVDGIDFLAWQRGESPDPLSAADLASWESAYITAESALVAVPEPTSIMLVAIGVFGLLRQQRP